MNRESMKIGEPGFGEPGVAVKYYTIYGIHRHSLCLCVSLSVSAEQQQAVVEVSIVKFSIMNFNNMHHMYVVIL